MKRLKWLHGALVALAAVALCLGLQVGLGSAARADTIPVVTSVSPDSGPMTGGTSVVITGSGFTNATYVYFGYGASLPFTVVSDTEITTTTQAGSGVVDAFVANDAGASAATSADQFTYVPVGPPTPEIYGVSPSFGPTSGGTTLTITGSGLTGTAGQ